MSSPKKPPKLVDRVRKTLRTNRYNPRTEKVYLEWIERFIRFHGVRHPQEMGAEEVKVFLSHLATQMKFAASTQNHAFSALLFFRSGCLDQTSNGSFGFMMLLFPHH
jgi:Phage integrase, N-terminal SAM-like domain